MTLLYKYDFTDFKDLDKPECPDGFISQYIIDDILEYNQGSHPGGGKRDRLLWHSRKKEPSESSARRAAGGLVQPVRLHWCTQFEQRDSFVFRLL